MKLPGIAFTVAGVAALAAPCTAMAASAPMVLPGGLLDPSFPNADVYVGTPKAAQPSDNPACKVAHEYVTLINAGDYARVADLYAEHATFLEPTRPTLFGREAIRAFYVKRIGSMKPQVMPVSYLGEGRECVVTLALGTKIGDEQRYVLVSVDHFQLDEDGKVLSMTAFARPERHL